MDKNIDTIELDEETQKLIDSIIMNYNKVIPLLNDYEDPSTYDLLMSFLFPHLHLFTDYKANELLAALAVVTLVFNGEDENNTVEEKIFRSLRVLSKKRIIYTLTDKMMDLLERNDKSDIDFDEEDDYQDRLIMDELRDEVIALIMKHKGEIKNPNIEKPFDSLLELQTGEKIDLELIDEIEDLIMDAQDLGDSMTEVYAYSLLHICPYAYGAMTVLLKAGLEEEDYISLLQLIENAYLFVHPDIESSEDLSKMDEYEEYHGYILALDSLAFIYKGTGRFEEAIQYYEKLLSFDREDSLEIKESIILPYLVTGRFIELEAMLEELGEESIVKAYFYLFRNLKNNDPFHEEYVSAFDASPMVMKFICEENTDLYKELNQKERSFIDDFYQIYIANEDVMTPLQALYNEE